MNDPILLRAALKWALKHGVNVSSWNSEFRDKGCGCCSGSIDPPAEIDALVREMRRELVQENEV